MPQPVVLCVLPSYSVQHIQAFVDLLELSPTIQGLPISQSEHIQTSISTTEVTTMTSRRFARQQPPLQPPLRLF